MRGNRHFGWCSVLCLSALLAPASGGETNQTQHYERQIRQLQDNFERQQREMRESLERMIREQQAQIDALRKELVVRNGGPSPGGGAVGTNAEAAGVRSPAPAAGAPDSQVPPADGPWSPTDPIRLAGNERNYLNLSFDALVAAGTSTANDIENLELGAHDPNQRGFTVQNLETTFEGRVDPYFRGQASILLQIDRDGESLVEVEEAFAETLSLPLGLQVRAGQYFSEFGRLNQQHPHAWDFADQPLVNGRFFGGDGLRNPGARVSWLAPTRFYSELLFGVQNSQGETAYSFRGDHEDEPFMGRLATERGVESLGDMLFVPRYMASFDLTDAQTLVAGTSAAFGPNTGGRDTDTQIYGVDLYWRWKSPKQHGGFPFVTWQTEAMARRYQAGAFDWDLNRNGSADPGEAVDLATGAPALLPSETLTDFGLYSQIAYGFRRGWVAALRGDYLFPEKTGKYERILGKDPDRASRWRISPNLTYFPTEFSKLRLQYNYDDRDGIGDDHSVWLQLEFLLGSHAAHKF
jgi:hypothetical protein